jgi:phosphomannomutase
VTFPNPEEEGALDLAIALAEEEGADLIIANDPDADRLAAVVPWEGRWRPLSGNEVGVLLGDYVLRHYDGDETPIVINSIVSSPMLGRVADRHGALFERTLTGFKWIANAAMAMEKQGRGTFVFGYEEALGYTVGPTVRDKDGISAALVFADLVAGLSGDGQTVIDRLEELWQSAGVWVSAQHSIVRKGAAGQKAIEDAINSIGDEPPAAIAEHRVTDVSDYRSGAELRPPWLGNQNLIELALGESGRILVRPSGTEPKLKIYVDLAAPAGGDLVQQQGELQRSAEALAVTVEELLPI